MNSAIKIDFCNSCDSGQRVPVVEMRTGGNRVVNECKSCAPSEFEQASQEFIDAWLKGDG